MELADRVDFGDEHARSAIAERLRRALADVAEAGNRGDLAREHHVGAAADGVDERFLAAIKIVELRLGDAVVDVDRGEGQLALHGDVVQAVDAGRRFLRSEEHTSELQSLMRISYDVFCLKKKTNKRTEKREDRT